MPAPIGPDDLPVELATALRESGLRWHPTAGDRFVVTDGTLDGDVFTVSDMVVEVMGEATGGQVLGFNGTTEWALDSVPLESALWIPREDQLRRLLGRAFRRLEAGDDGHRVVLVRSSGSAPVPAAVGPAEPAAPSEPDGVAGERVFTGRTAAEAYGQAVLDTITRALD